MKLSSFYHSKEDKKIDWSNSFRKNKSIFIIRIHMIKHRLDRSFELIRCIIVIILGN